MVDKVLCNNKKLVLIQNYFFNHMCSNSLNSFIKNYNWYEKTYLKGEVDFNENIFLKDLNIVLKGSIKIAKVMENGLEILYDIVEEKSCFGFASVYESIKLEGLYAEAMKDSCIFCINYDEFEKIIKENPIFFKKFMVFQEYRLLFFIRRFENSFITSPYEKLLYFFNYSKQLNIFEIKMQKTHLANYLNIGRASLYRELNKMHKESIIKLCDNKILILNI